MSKKILPNLLTFANLSFGVLSMLAVIRQNYILGAVFIMLSALIDRYDGRVAKYLNATSELGKELDSLADMVSFGVAPSLLIINKLIPYNDGLLTVIAIFCILPYVISGSYRLAKYNTAEFDGYFNGVPITIAGFILAAYSLVSPDNYLSAIISIILLVLLAYLMVSKFKFKKI